MRRPSNVSETPQNDKMSCSYGYLDLLPGAIAEHSVEETTKDNVSHLAGIASGVDAVSRFNSFKNEVFETQDNYYDEEYDQEDFFSTIRQRLQGKKSFHRDRRTVKT